MTASFQRVNPLGDAIIRGPARLLVAPITQAFPTSIESVIWTPATSSSYVADVQTVAITGTPSGGTFTLSYLSVQTAPIAYNATSSAVASALNALPGIANVGGVTASGGPLPATAVVVTFVNTGFQPLMLAQSTGLTGGTTPAVTVTHTTSGVGQYDPMAGWSDLGSTKTGVQIMRNNTESAIDIDQILATLTAIPDEWEMTVTTAFAETTLENIQIAWEGGTIYSDATQTPNERHLPLGAPLAYTERRLAVIHQKTIGTSAGRLRMAALRRVTRSPANSVLDYQKTGNQQTLPHTFRAFADSAVADPYARFGEIIEQLAF
jgi:hypothetical protein